MTNKKIIKGVEHIEVQKDNYLPADGMARRVRRIDNEGNPITILPDSYEPPSDRKEKWLDAKNHNRDYINSEKAIYVTSRSQRNFLDELPAQNDIDNLIEIATKSPTRQRAYDLIVSKDKEFGKTLWDNVNDAEDIEPGEDAHRHSFSGARAPLVFVWIYKHKKHFTPSATFELGLSLGITAHTATMLGYNVGMCYRASINHLTILDDLKNKHNIEADVVGAILGIGKAVPGKLWNNDTFIHELYPEYTENYHYGQYPIRESQVIKLGF
tara:strand:- start:53 stop:859 length:807 start_codon:yes stop_codon:yes gene_type:complete